MHDIDEARHGLSGCGPDMILTTVVAGMVIEGEEEISQMKDQRALLNFKKEEPVNRYPKLRTRPPIQ